MLVHTLACNYVGLQIVHALILNGSFSGGMVSGALDRFEAFTVR